MSNIRVGMIGCDLHGFYYGGLMFKHDPLELRDHKVCPVIGHTAHFYFYTFYADPRAMTVPMVKGFELARVWDTDRKRAETMADVYGKDAKVCESFEEVSDDVDLVFIPDCMGDGSDHLELARPGLVKGVPTFVDKPFACEVGDAKKIVQLATKHKTVVISISMLKTTPQTAYFRNRFVELGEPEFGIVKGGGPTLDGQIHAISLAQALFGAGVETVHCMGKTPLGYIHLDYGQKPDRPGAGVVVNCDSGGTNHCCFYASAYSKMGAIHSPGIGDFEFPWGAGGILKKLKKMVRTRAPQEPYEEMIEGIAIANAARLGQESGKQVHIKDVLAGG